MNQFQNRMGSFQFSKGTFITLILLVVGLWSNSVEGFSTSKLNANHRKGDQCQQQSQRHERPTWRSSLKSAASSSATETTSSKGFGTVKEPVSKGDDQKKTNDTRPVDEIKQELLDLLPRMTGQEEEFRKVEQLVNALEAKYVPAQTLGFLNMALAGDWQLLFSTNLAAVANPAQFRLRELRQRIAPNTLEGTVTNQAVWDLAEDEDNVFDATGTFAAECTYTINQGARMVLDLDEHVLKPSRGSKIPQDVPGLVGRLHRSMPKELFDPQDHAMDTTYLDADLRIARMTGARLEGVRDIFVRIGGLESDN